MAEMTQPMTDEQLASLRTKLQGNPLALAFEPLLATIDARDAELAASRAREAALVAETARLRGLVARHHDFGVMQRMELGRLCPVCQEHDPEVRAAIAAASSPAGAEEGER